MKLSEKQQAIVNLLRLKGRVTTKDFNELLEKYYYHNHAHYISEILTNMVKKRYIKRVSKGVYELGSFSNSIPGIKDENQTNLF